MGPLAQSVRELKIPPDLSAFTPPATAWQYPPKTRIVAALSQALVA